MGGRLNHGPLRGVSNGEDYFGWELTLSRTMVLVRQAIARGSINQSILAGATRA